MPLYTCHVLPPLSKQAEFVQRITKLHTTTFGGDGNAVRVDFIVSPMEGTVFRYGGYGFQWSKGFFGTLKTSDCIEAKLDFRGTAEEWQAYCQEIVKIWIPGRQLRTIYLRKTDFEFQVVQENMPGHVVGLKSG